MQYKAGDRVKFLNSTGGGVVARVGSKGVVYVEIEDGFEIPVMSSDLVGVSDVTSHSGRIFTSVPEVEVPDKAKAKAKAKATPEVRHEKQRDIRPGTYPGKQMVAGLYLVFKPLDQRILTMGDLEVLLVNHTDYPVAAQLFLGGAGDYRLQGTHTLPAQRAVIVDRIPRAVAGEWTQGVLQCMVQPEKAEQLLLPVHTSFHVASARLTRAKEFELTSLDPQAILAISLKLASTLKVAGAVGADKGKPTEVAPRKKTAPSESSRHQQEKVAATKPEPLIKKHLNERGEAVVDLHLHNLVPDRWDLHPLEALKYQTQYFQRALESAIAERVPRLVVIHGVGSGVLKAEVLKQAEATGNAYVFDAPIKEYGLGATVIEFYHSKNEQLRNDLS